MHRHGMQLASSSSSARISTNVSAPLITRRHRSGGNSAANRSRAAYASQGTRETARLIDRVAETERNGGRAPHNWRHSQSRHGEQQRLEDAVGPVQRRQDVNYHNLQDDVSLYHARRQEAHHDGHRRADSVHDKIRTVQAAHMSTEQLRFMSQPSSSDQYDTGDSETPTISPSIDIGSFIEIRRCVYIITGILLVFTFLYH